MISSDDLGQVFGSQRGKVSKLAVLTFKQYQND